MLRAQPHVDEIVKLCSVSAPNADIWAEIRGSIVGVHDVRRGWSCRMQRRDGSVVDCAMAPLPDGATLLTFTDVTASVNVERALTEQERGAAKAARLQGRLRPPCLVRAALAAHQHHRLHAAPCATRRSVRLNDRQREYAGHIMRSSDGARRHRQRHSRPRHDRQRPDGARRSRPWISARPSPPPPRASRIAWPNPNITLAIDAPRRHRHLHRRRQARASGAVQPAVQRRRLLGSPGQTVRLAVAQDRR